MSFDAHKNLAIATVTTATGAAGTTLGVGVGEGARFPAVPFNATVWPFDMAPDPTTAEVVRVTARTGDSLTITRAQEGTTARAIVAGDLIAATITAKSLTDIESGVNFPLITTPGNVTVGTTAIPYPQVILQSTNAAGEGGFLTFKRAGVVDGYVGSGPPVATDTGGVAMDAQSGHLTLMAKTANTGIRFITGGASAERGRIHQSGGFSWGGTTDPGAANLSVQNALYFNTPGSGVNAIGMLTNDGADNGRLALCGGATYLVDRGSAVTVAGNESAATGTLQLLAGDVAGGNIDFFTGATALRGRIHQSGGFSWGGTTDPGVNNILVGTAIGVAIKHVMISPGAIQSGTDTVSAYTHQTFFNPNSACGSIVTTGTTTAYNTASDARLKTPLTRHTDPSVLRDTIIHNFVWKSDGTAGRGVFAQEAHRVAPFAVSVGTDETDDEGRLTHPWGVDYSKYVPDLIAGWQYHDTRMTAFFHDHLLAAERITALEKRLSIPQPSLMTRLRMALRKVGDFFAQFTPIGITR